MCFYNRFIYQDGFNGFSGYDASKWNLSVEDGIISHWRYQGIKNKILNIATLGLASYFQMKTTSLDEVKNRIDLLKNEAEKMDKAARVIQVAFARKRYFQARKISKGTESFTRPQISSSSLGVPLQFLHSCLNSFELDMLNPKGQIIWQKVKGLRNFLRKESNSYIYVHTHSFPITLHLDLSTHFQSMHQSAVFRRLKPLENRTMFRSRGIAKHYKNTESYLKSFLGKAINAGWTIDDRHRESIISCDGIVDNKQPYESARHFLNSNKSIVDTASSTGMKHSDFDGNFIKAFISNPNLCEYAKLQFQEARLQLKELPSYGAIKVIAIQKERIKDCKTNYVWRSHAFGVACRCGHSSEKWGHNEFIATLEKHQNDIYSPCKVKSFYSSLPQYRILAENIDRDHTKQIFKIDCLTEAQRHLYTKTYNTLQRKLSPLIRLEKLDQCKNYFSLMQSLSGIEVSSASKEYHQGLESILRKHKTLIATFSLQLEKDLKQSQWQYIQNSLLA